MKKKTSASDHFDLDSLADLVNRLELAASTLDDAASKIDHALSMVSLRGYDEKADRLVMAIDRLDRLSLNSIEDVAGSLHRAASRLEKFERE